MPVPGSLPVTTLAPVSSSDGIVTAIVDPGTASVLLTVNFGAAGVGADRVTVTRTTAAGSEQVRGMDQRVSPNAVCAGIDHTVPAGTSCTYQAVAFNAAGVVATSTTATVLSAAYPALGWLKHLTTPRLSMSVLVNTYPDWSAGITQGVFAVIGRPDSVIVSDVRQLATGTLTLLTQTRAELTALRALLAATGPYLFQGSPDSAEPDVYVSVGAVSEARTSRIAADQSRYVALPLTVQAKPGTPGAVVSLPGHTLADSLRRWPALSNRSGKLLDRSTT